MGVVLNRYHHVFSIVYYFAYFQCHHLRFTIKIYNNEK